LNSRQKKTLAAGAGALGLLLLAMRRTGKGTVLLGPVTVTQQKVDLGAATDADVQRLVLAIKRSQQLMGIDPNTLASRQPSPADVSYIQGTLDLARRLSLISHGTIPYPTVEEQRLALAQKLPGDALQKANAELYALLGVDPSGTNEASLPLTPATEARARTLIAQWRPYSQDAVDTLFVLLDEARDLAGGGAA
jgi:hypothetical protein